jgi:hypothetical protein
MAPPVIASVGWDARVEKWYRRRRGKAANRAKGPLLRRLRRPQPGKLAVYAMEREVRAMARARGDYFCHSGSVHLRLHAQRFTKAELVAADAHGVRLYQSPHAGWIVRFDAGNFSTRMSTEARAREVAAELDQFLYDRAVRPKLVELACALHASGVDQEIATRVKRWMWG